MKKAFFALCLLFAGTETIAGQACNDIRYMCPGSLCYAQEVACQIERESEARIRRLAEAEEAAAAEKKRSVEAAIVESQKREQENMKSANTSAPPAVSATSKKVSAKPSRQESRLPKNAKWNPPPEIGWSCLDGFHLVELACVKNK